MNRYIIFFTLWFTKGLFAESSKNIFIECKPDIQTFCFNLNKNIKKIQCLLENESKISDICQNTLDLYLAELKKRGSSVCKHDIKTHCKWVIPGGGRIIKCLLAKEEEISEPCKNKINEI